VNKEKEEHILVGEVDQKLILTPLTPSYAHVDFPYPCGSSMFMRLLYAKARGLRERTESRRRSGEAGVDFEEVYTEGRDGRMEGERARN
jgi:hypothetical protein